MVQVETSSEDKDEDNVKGAAALDESYYSVAEDTTPVKRNEPASRKEMRVLRDRTTLKAPTKYEENIAEHNIPVTF